MLSSHPFLRQSNTCFLDMNKILTKTTQGKPSGPILAHTLWTSGHCPHRMSKPQTIGSVPMAWIWRWRMNVYGSESLIQHLLRLLQHMQMCASPLPLLLWVLSAVRPPHVQLLQVPRLLAQLLSPDSSMLCILLVVRRATPLKRDLDQQRKCHPRALNRFGGVSPLDATWQKMTEWLSVTHYGASGKAALRRRIRMARDLRALRTCPMPIAALRRRLWSRRGGKRAAHGDGDRLT
mmetsp:Transcript_17091/g.47853  ORF Transcript_17091/g.47853 Transcript_17091/m.47853 type:complete len:235 (+) Transcript_17091:979-1683(+)